MSKTIDALSSSRLTFQRLGQLLCFTCLIASGLFLSPHPLLAGGWTASNLDAAFDPVNRRGRNPLDRSPAPGVHVPTLRKSSNALQDAAGAGSSNFQIIVPVVNLPGRGIGLALNLTYNSRLWTTAGPDLRFDIDADWPAPGWSLGFGKLVDAGTQSMLIDGDGTRHPFYGTYDAVTQTFTAYTRDGTLIDYWRQMSGSSGQVKYPNGNIVDFTVPGPAGVDAYPTRITDANGNYLTIQYVNNKGPQIAQVIDTLGRIFVFNYDSTTGLLTAITGPDLNGGTRTIIRLHYTTFNLQPAISHGFSIDGVMASADNPQPWLVDAIYDPATGAGYWFGDPAASFSAYGMVAQVEKQRAMGFTANSLKPLTDQGTVTPGTMTRKQVYDFPLATNPPLTDAPGYSTMTETWDSMDTPTPAVTQYIVDQQATPRRLEVVQPDGAHHVQLSYNHPKFFDDGLVYQDQIQDAAQNILQQTTVTWQNDTYGPYRTRLELTDERQQVTATELSYGVGYNQVTEVREYDYGGTQVLRSTDTDYGAQSSYVPRHIFNLPTQVAVYSGAAGSGICESRTEYFYDGQPLANTPAVVSHDDASNPFAPKAWVPSCSQLCGSPGKPCQMICNGGQWQTSYQPATDLRGNVTQITRYTDAYGSSGPIIETRGYDIAGNPLSVSSAPGTEERFDYTAATQYAYPTAHVRGTPQPYTTHIASNEFLGVQGYQQWSYLGSISAQLSYDPATGVWQSSNTNAALIPSGGLPGDLGDDAVRRWTAPAGGPLHITGNAQSLNPTGTQIPNNVVVSIRQGSQTLWQATLNSWEAPGPAFDIATVAAPGDTIDFVIHKNHLGNVVDVDGVDATLFDPTLEFTPWAATLSASASQPGVGWAWGASGNLGDGSTPNRSTPGQVSALTQLVAVAAGGHTLALASDGSVWAWGNNGNGQLGDGTTTTRFAPTQVVGLGGVAAIAAGVTHSLALTKDGAVWAWGINTFGQLV